MGTIDVGTLDRIRGCLWGIFIADALSMPVHWYYNPDDIVRHFGKISKCEAPISIPVHPEVGYVSTKPVLEPSPNSCESPHRELSRINELTKECSDTFGRYEAPKEKHPSSIMNLSNTGGHGRGGQQGSVIGDVINHGKKKFWGGRNVHYHQGMQPGENTLNALCARVAMRSITNNSGRYDASKWLEAYVSFMTTPGSHNDTYAESYHRDFFLNFSKGVKPENCSKGTEGHNTAQIGAFVTMPPVVMSCITQGLTEATTTAFTHLRTTHDSVKLEPYAEKYARLLFSTVTGSSASEALDAIGMKQQAKTDRDDFRVVYQDFGPACYIESAFPVTAHIFRKYENDFEAGVLANTNVGGENCHRGAAIGALLGARNGESGIPAWLKEGLHDYAAIKEEIDAFVSSLQTCQP